MGPARSVALACALIPGCLQLNPAFDGQGTGGGGSDGGSGGSTAGGPSSTDASVTGGQSDSATTSVTGGQSDSAASTASDTDPSAGTTDAVSCEPANPCDRNAVCSVVDGALQCECEEGFVGDGFTCTVEPSLPTLRWEVPCMPVSCGAACKTEFSTVSSEGTLIGEPGATYAVVLRIRGVVEEKTYFGGNSDGRVNEGGSPAVDDWNEMYLEVFSPPQKYWINNGTSGNGYCVPLDYTRAVTIAVGATVRIGMYDPNLCQILNRDMMGEPIVIPEVPPDPAPFDGQFVQVDTVTYSLL